MKQLSLIKSAIKHTIRDYKYNLKHLQLHLSLSSEIEYSFLRMYCHMLDKGMNNAYFESGHSQSVFNETQMLYEKLLPIYGNDREYEWIREIISRFEKAQKVGKPSLNNTEPYVYSSTDIENHLNFIRRRTSCRNFLQKEIPNDIINKIVEIAIDAPNGCCRQVVRYYISQNKSIVKEAQSMIEGMTNFTNVQCLVCVAAEISYYDIVDKNLRYIDASLSTENFLLGASLYGVYGTICNFLHASNTEVSRCKELFGVKDSEDIIMFIAIGYPTVIPEKPARRDLDVFYKIV